MRTIEFKEEAVKEYLDDLIRFWRRERKLSNPGIPIEMITCYIDAYQCVRSELFGSCLPVEEKEMPYVCPDY